MIGGDRRVKFTFIHSVYETRCIPDPTQSVHVAGTEPIMQTACPCLLLPAAALFELIVFQARCLAAELWIDSIVPVPVEVPDGEELEQFLLLGLDRALETLLHPAPFARTRCLALDGAALVHRRAQILVAVLLRVATPLGGEDGLTRGHGVRAVQVKSASCSLSPRGSRPAHTLPALGRAVGRNR